MHQQLCVLTLPYQLSMKAYARCTNTLIDVMTVADWDLWGEDRERFSDDDSDELALETQRTLDALGDYACTVLPHHVVVDNLISSDGSSPSQVFGLVCALELHGLSIPSEFVVALRDWVLLTMEGCDVVESIPAAILDKLGVEDVAPPTTLNTLTETLMASPEEYEDDRTYFMPVDVDTLSPAEFLTEEQFRLLDELGDYACSYLDAVDIGIAGMAGDGDPDVEFYYLISNMVRSCGVKIPRKYYDAYVAWSKTRPGKIFMGRKDIDSWFEPEV